MRPRRFGGSCAAAVLVVGAIAFVGGRAFEYARETADEGSLAAANAPATSPVPRARRDAAPDPPEPPATTAEPPGDARERTGSPPSTPSPAGALDDLRARGLTIPVSGVAAAQLRPAFDDAREGRRHEALDIMAPRGTPVLAVEDGRIARLFTSRPGGLTIYEFDSTQRYAYYYAHLDRYAAGLHEGQRVKEGEVIGYVGSTGNASPDAPHLHFAIFALGLEKRWWEGTPIDPFLVWRSGS